MPLTGEAKRQYMAEYHRRRRAGLPTRAAEDDVPWCNFCGKRRTKLPTGLTSAINASSAPPTQWLSGEDPGGGEGRSRRAHLLWFPRFGAAGSPTTSSMLAFPGLTT